ncbi:CocE/NonD family hydrolase [Aquihabitans daechungensis]|uniref:CocE/NonD family hydrolase n=1 Tax=Aquihabitans daechungensis TaxID=1052257 RepID=UPI003BA0FBDF
MRRLAPAVLLTTALVLASCSSGGSDAATDTTTSKPEPGTSTTVATGDDAGEGHACDQGAAFGEVAVEPVDGVASDLTMTSFDDTAIRLHWFPVEGASADEPAPTILMGPGWSLAGDTSTDGAALFGALSIGAMWDAGYNVLTWDPRGFGRSEGVATVNDPAKEGKDVQAMLDFVAEQPEARTDAEGDPRAGMVGFSYGGGIQLTSAALDCRIDALVPGIAWNSLETSLYKAETVKTGWSKILTSTVDPERLDPHINSASASGLRDGSLSDEDHDWFLSRGPGDEAIEQIDVPTLFIQGTVDTLFTLDEATRNYEILKTNDVPTANLWFCGGHGTCLTDPGDGDRVGRASFNWLDHHLQGKPLDPVPDLAFLDQEGTEWTVDEWDPDPDAIDHWAGAVADGPVTLELTDASRSGGGGETDPGDPLGGLVAGITPTKAATAIEATYENASDHDVLLLGAPKLRLTYSGTLPEGETDGRLFAQLIDDESGLVVGNQITPIEVELDGSSHELEVPLEMIAHRLPAGSSVTLQLVATTSAYATPPLGGQLEAEELGFELPFAPDSTSDGATTEDGVITQG